MIYRDMNKYHNGKIYKVVDVGYNKCYMGSTTESLSQRMARHRSAYKKHKEGKLKTCFGVFDMFNEFGENSCKIELIEYFKSETREELLKKEGEYIRINDCVNKRVAGRTREEFRKENADEINKKNRLRRENNIDICREYDKIYYHKNKEIITSRIREWQTNNNEKVQERRRLYREKNKETIQVKNSEKHVCQCGGKFTRQHIKAHERTKKHQEYLKTLTQED